MSELSESVRSELRDQMSAMQQLVQSGSLEPAYIACGRIRDRIEALRVEYPDSAELEDLHAAMLTNLADLAEQQGEWGQAESSWRNAIPILRQLATKLLTNPRPRQLLAQAQYRLGELYLITYQPADAEPLFREAVEVWESIPSMNSFALARAYAKLGESERQLRRASDSLRHYQQARERFEKLSADGDDQAGEELAHVRHQLGLIHRDLNQFPEAIEELHIAAALLKHYPFQIEQRANVLTDLAKLYHSTNQPDAAEEALRRLVIIRAEQSDDQCYRRGLVAAINQLGVLYLETGRMSRAESTFATSEKMAAGHPENDPGMLVNLAITNYYHGRSLRLLSRDGARSAFERVLTLPQSVREEFTGLLTMLQTAEFAMQLPIPPRLPELKAAFLTWRLPGPPPLMRDHGEPPADLVEPFRQARTFAAERQFDKATEVLVGLLESNRSLPVQYDLIDLLRTAGRENAAIPAVNQLLKEQPKYADGWFLRGLILARFLDDAGGPAEPIDFARHEVAIDSFDEAILLTPDDADFRLWKGRALFRSAHALLARDQAMVEACRKENVEHPDALVAMESETQCAIQRACESFRIASKLRPEDAEAPFALGVLLIALAPTRVDEAKIAFREALVRNPDFTQAREELARLG